MASSMPSTSTILSTYASLSTATMLFRTILSEMLPRRIRDYISSKFSESLSHYFFPNFTLIVEQYWQATTNHTFRAVETYLPTIIGTSADSLHIGSHSLVPHKLNLRIPVGCKTIDEFQGMKLEWSLHKETINSSGSHPGEVQYFYQLKCKRSDRAKVMTSYLPHIANTARTILNRRENLYIYTYDENIGWKSAVFKHPATFATLAMDPKSKAEIMEDLDTFVQQKDFFQRVGRSWKRGYFLHGPPGTGKSSLVAAIANHQRYNIYDLQLQSVRSDAELRRILTSTTNRSILLVEDIDCSTKASRDRTKTTDEQEEPGQGEQDHRLSSDPGVTLSGLLNFTDGLWSSFGDERLIIFTTNHKDKLDPALLRPGRMDLEIYMGYCTFAAFKQLAKSYLQIDNHHLFAHIEKLLILVSVTPAEVAQQLMMKSNELQDILESFIEFLKGKLTKELSKHRLRVY